LVVTSDQNGTKHFINGHLTAINSTIISTTFTLNKDFALGTNVSPDGVMPFVDVNQTWWNGQLDDIAIWNRALTQQEITNLYNASVPPPPCNPLPSNLQTGLVGYWPLSGNANDESGNGNHGTVNGATLTTDRFGDSGKAYSFDGVDDYIESTDIGISGNSARTVSFWAKTQSAVVMGLVSWGGNGTTPNNGNRFSCDFNYSSQGVTIDGADCAITYSPLKPVTNNEWSFYTFTMNAGSILNQVKVYQNGILLASILHNYKGGTVLNTLSNTLLQFGRINYPPNNFNWFNGSLDDIAIWNRALDSTEITQLYQTQSSNLSEGNVGVNVAAPQRSLHIKDAIRLEPRNTPLENPVKGDMYFDGQLNKLRVFDGTIWQNCW
jgi:hypothetical protein